MANEIGKGVVGVTFDTKKGLADAQTSIVGAVGKIAANAASIFAAKKIFDIGKEGIAEIESGQKVAAQTGVVLKNLGATAGVTSQQVNQLAQAQLKLSGVDDEVAQSAENTLLRLGVTGKAFTEATVDANDLSIAMGNGPEGMAGAAELLGKALAHPEMAARLLKPAIGGLTSEQTASIKAFAAQNNIAGEQSVIFAAVESKVKGAAAAYGKTLPGQLQIAQEEMTNTKAALVGGLAPALKLGAEGVTFLNTEFQQLPQAAQATVGGIALVVGGVASLARPLRDVVQLWDRFRTTRDATTATASAGAAVEVAASTEVTEADMRRIVANEQVSFTDKQVADAMQARKLAEMQALIGNDALIASDEELAAAESAAEVTTIGLTTAIGLIAAPIAIAIAAYEGWKHSLSVNVDAQAATRASTAELVTAYDQLAHIFGDVQAKFAKGLDLGTLERLRDAEKAAGKDTSALDALIRQETGAQQQANADAQRGASAMGDLASSVSKADGPVRTLGQDIADLDSQLQASLDPLFGMVDAMKQQADAQAASHGAAVDLLTAQAALNKLQREAHPNAKSLADAQQAVADATAKVASTNLDAARAAEGMQAASDKLTQSVLAGSTSVADAQTQLKAWVAQGLLTQQQADAVGGKFAYAAGAAANLSTNLNGLDGRQVNVAILLDYIQRGVTPLKGAHAAGGYSPPGEVFRGAEKGYELMVLPSDGTYQSPPSGGYVLNHEDSLAAVAGLGDGGSSRPIVVNLVVDGRQIAQAIAPPQRTRNRALA